MATPLSKTLTLPNSFSGTRKSIQSPVLRSISLIRGSHSAKSFVVKASVSSNINK
jgi:peroxiredoxin (alkyl hydroperoxide reductase subunit C)